MRWWKHLYMGDRAMNHILDIRPVLLLTEKEREDEGFLILGVAKGYGEAGEVVRSMVDDMYRATGAFDWNAYMGYLDAADQRDDT